MALPKLGLNGLLPPGVHRATPGDVRWAFGVQGIRRMALISAVEEALEHARKAGIFRVLLDGSFVTSREKPRDVDMVVWVSAGFRGRLTRGDPDAMWMAERAGEPHPGFLSLFVVTNHEEWKSWVGFFEVDTWHGKKGLVEVAI